MGYHVPMSGPTLDVKAGGRVRTVSLQAGLTRIGPSGMPGADVEVEGASGELHVWDNPPKAVRARGEDALVGRGGGMVEELELADGDSFAWGGAKFRFRGQPVLEEIVEEPPAGAEERSYASAPALAAVSGPTAEMLRRLSAGLLVETGLADKKTAKRWQSAVLQNQWDPDACATEILSDPGARDALSDPRVQQRAARLQRDLVMASYQRGMKGASRRVRGAARSTSAFFLANLIAIVVYSGIIVALLIVARVGYDWSIDGVIDRIMDAVTPG